jgi:hypothetical protein
LFRNRAGQSRLIRRHVGGLVLASRILFRNRTSAVTD